MMAETAGEDFNKIHKVMVEGYPRAGSLPSAGFAAGPCLFKDTMQLLSFAQNNFGLGYHAMLVNEGLVLHIVNKLKIENKLNDKSIGLLGMAFKANVDDTRDSLSFRLSKILKFSGAEVFCSDEFAKNPDFVTKEEIIDNCETVIIATPHSNYNNLKFPESIDVIDIW